MDLTTASPVLAPPAARPRPSDFRLYGGRIEALARPSGRGRLIVTPNLDHLRLLSLSAALRRAYRQADVVLNDSRFLDKAAVRGRVPCLPGSELAPMMLAAAAPGTLAFVIGSEPAVERRLREACPAVEFRFVDPSMGFVRRRSERRALARAVLAAQPELVFVCTGAPQSELLAAQLKRAGSRADILCCGSAFHFLAGTKSRAPLAARRMGLEWFWRFVTEPRTRRRYAADALFLLRAWPAFLALRLTGRADFGRFGLSAV